MAERRAGAAVLLAAILAMASGCARIRPPQGVAPVERTMVVTGYCKCGICCGWRRTWYGRPVYAGGPLRGQRKQVGITASGARARFGTIAADTRLYPFGTVMYVAGYGVGRVEDTGKLVKGEHIDLFFPTHGQALRWGSRKIRVMIWPAHNARR